MTAEPDGVPPPPPEAEPPADPPPAPAPAAAPSAWRRWSRHAQFSILVAGCAAIVASNVYLIQRGPLGAGAEPGASASVANSAAPPPAHGEGTAVPLVASASASAPVLDADAGPAPQADEPSHDEEPPAPEKPDKPDKSGKQKGVATVGEAAKRACSTAPIEGLSRQIIAEARCLDSHAFARVPARKNLQNNGHVFLYLDAPARDHLLRALDANPKKVLKVHSALRTVAQQYLLSRWGAGKRCGVQLANRPGESNHETGLALDVAEPGTWRKALESEGFRWLGSIDRVHFDFVGPGATHHDGLDVRAFQRLWNRNHPDDTISETGRYDAATEIRLKKSPAGGFPVGARCGARANAG